MLKRRLVIPPRVPAPHAGPTAQFLHDLLRDIGPPAVACAVLLAASFLPADTALRQVDAAGELIACMPAHNPPRVVAGSPERPGFDVELLREISARSGWRLTILPTDADASGVRAWGAPRAPCHILAGGIATSAAAHDVLDATPGRPPGGLAAIAGSDRPARGLTAAADREPIGFGFWRGQRTLRRHFERELARLVADGAVAELASAYGLAVAPPCPGPGRPC